MVRRTPYLFYGLTVLFGLSSGFVFERFCNTGVCRDLMLWMGRPISIWVLSGIGVIAGLLFAYHFHQQYICANNAIPWLLLSPLVLIVPFLIALVIGMVAAILIAILKIIVWLIIFSIVVSALCNLLRPR